MNKVLFVATVTGHINMFHIPYLKLFKENGYEVHVASFGDEPIEYCDKHYNIPFERFPLKPKNYKAYKELKKIINENNYEIIHCHTPVGGVLTRLAAKKARKNGTRVIYTAHGFHFYKGAPLLNWIIYYPIEKYLAKYTDTLITINREDFELANRKFSRKCNDINYLTGMGVDDSIFNNNITQNKKEQLRKKIKLSNKDFIIIYPARLCPDKNQILLLKLMKELNDNNIILLLPGRDEYKGYYQKYVNENKIKNVKFLGERDDIPELLKISDMLIASSIREGFGINLVEALASSIPVIAVDNRGHRDIVKDGINGYIVKNDINDLNNIFSLIYQDKELYKKIKENSNKSVERFFLYNSLKIMKEIYKL